MRAFITTSLGQGGGYWGTQRGLGVGPELRRPLSACSSQELTCCAGWRQQGDECGIGE